MSWPKGPTRWIEDRILYVSIPFTWDLPEERAYLQQRSFEWDHALVGGPAVDLMPDMLDGIADVVTMNDYPGVLQKVNPQATRTSYGCPRRCEWCLMKDSTYRKLDDWPDLPVVIDENLLAAGHTHVERVCDRLRKHEHPDIEQGLDCRLLDDEYAEMLSFLPVLRLAFDSDDEREAWQSAYDRLVKHVAPSRIRSYVLIGFNDGPVGAWDRCRWIKEHSVYPLPMWFHPLDALHLNGLTDEQKGLGWTHRERIDLMRHYYGG